MRSALSFEEALPRPEPAIDPAVPLAERLQLCSRLLAVAADELTALERGDLALLLQAKDDLDFLCQCFNTDPAALK